MAGTAVLAERGTSRLCSVQANAGSRQWAVRTLPDSRWHYPCIWFTQRWYSRLVVEDGTLACALHRQAEQLRHPQPASTKGQLQPGKSQLKSLLNTRRISTAQGTCRAVGTIGGFTEGLQRGNTEHQPLSLYHFDIDMHLRAFGKVRGMVKFWAPCLDQSVLYFPCHAIGKSIIISMPCHWKINWLSWRQSDDSYPS